jgi:pimeloyl-ACP methyl ester carboxylesterase
MPDMDAHGNEWETLARAGIDAFAVNLLGVGLSDRFIMDDPCSANPALQQTLLIPNPLSAPCAAPLPFHFTNTNAERDQLNAVIDDVLSRTGVSQVTLHGWSQGGSTVGDYALHYPDKVKNIIFQSPGGQGNVQPTCCNPPNPLPQPGFPIGALQTRDVLFNNRWGSQVKCAGQRDPAILDPIWGAVRASDPVATKWGPTDPQTGEPGGLLRAPSVDVWGWSPMYTVPNVTVPALFLWGYLDNIAPNQALDEYPAIGSSKKVLVKIACASHFMIWESSASASWPGGPHKVLQDAAVEWIKSETYQGKSLGTFQVDANGNITGPF